VQKHLAAHARKGYAQHMGRAFPAGKGVEAHIFQPHDPLFQTGAQLIHAFRILVQIPVNFLCRPRHACDRRDIFRAGAQPSLLTAAEYDRTDLYLIAHI